MLLQKQFTDDNLHVHERAAKIKCYNYLLLILIIFTVVWIQFKQDVKTRSLISRIVTHRISGNITCFICTAHLTVAIITLGAERFISCLPPLFMQYIITVNVRLDSFPDFFFPAGLTVDQLFAALIRKDWTGGRMCLEGIKPTPSSLSTSTFHMCPAEDESFRQLEGHGSSVKPWPKTFGQVPQPEQTISPCCAHSCMTRTWTTGLGFAYQGDVKDMHMHNVVFLH